MEAGTRVGDVLFTVPRVLELAGWRAVVRCKGVCRAWRRQLASPFWFSVMNKAIARECALYLPPQATSGSERLFWDQLHPARGKWLREGEDGADGASAAAAQSFSIRVAVRFRPSRTAGKVRSFVLPLHQRLRLRRRGEQLHFEEEARGLDSDRLQGMVEAGEELPPDLIRALLEARRLEHLSRQAETGTTAADHWRDTSADEGRAAERAVGLGEAERSLSDGVEGVHGPEVPGEAAMVASSAESRSDLRDPTGGDSATAAADDLPLTSHKRKTGERARVMAVRKASVTVFVPGAGLRPFAFERVFDACAAQEQVYREAAQSAVISALNGFNACLFVYGQTGSGKTHTVFGPPGTLDCPFGDPSSLPSSAGLALRACRELIAGCDSMEGTRASLSATYVEIYQEKVTDLIGGGPVTLRAAGGGQVSLSGACETAVESMADLVDLLRRGDARKHSAATRMNARSSRAHTILVIKITQARDHRVISSHLHLVDLAGCEQLHQSGARGQQRREAIGINSSLLVLKKVITALVEERSHVPYLESSLTKILKSALGGASRTTAVVTASMDDEFAEQTLQALRFGESVAQISNATQQISGLSASDALAQLDGSIATCQATLATLELKGRTELPAFRKAAVLLEGLQRRRAALARLHPGPASSS